MHYSFFYQCVNTGRSHTNFGTRYAQLVICVRFQIDRIHKKKIHFYCVSPSQTDMIVCCDIIEPSLKKLRLSVDVVQKCFLVK